jgi:hypothetical protein
MQFLFYFFIPNPILSFFPDSDFFCGTNTHKKKRNLIAAVLQHKRFRFSLYSLFNQRSLPLSIYILHDQNLLARL